MDLKLKDKVALVTGAGSPIGFGRAIALPLAEEGCDVICADITQAWAEEPAALVEIVAINRRDGAWVRPAAVGLLRSSLPVAIGVVAWVLLARLHPWLSGVAIMPGAR